MWILILKPFKFLFAPMFTFALLTWIYSSLYARLGFDRMIQSMLIIFMLIGYKIIKELKEYNGNNRLQNTQKGK